ncbi:AAA family ATPase [Sanguibacter sp. A247]|uniref:AAA family ATPase n=1 Tax=unclassified Sanguibacter TaxID=2645534 RepID=UPI003FD71FB4
MDDGAAREQSDPLSTPVPRRIRIHGTSGSGKTTLARQVAARTGLVRIELDEVFWDTGWQQKDPVDGRSLLRTRLAAAENGPGWVADGNWRSRVLDLLNAADTIVCLDLPRRTIMRRIVGRTLARGITRRPLWHGNREHLTNLVRRDPEHNIVLWSWRTWAENRARWDELEVSGAPVVRLCTPREVRTWLNSLPHDPHRATRSP